MITLDYDKLIDGRGRLKPERVDDLLVEVISGKYLFTCSGEVYASRVCTPAESDTARLIYVRRMGEAVAAGMMTRDQLEDIAIKEGLFDPRDRALRIGLEKHIERCQKSRDHAPTAEGRASIEKEIREQSIALARLQAKEEEIFRQSADARADEARANYLTSVCTMRGELLDCPVWPSFQSYQSCSDQALLIESRRAQMRVFVGLPVNIIRALARTPEWRVRWRAARESRTPVFEGFGASWDRNKVNLVSWSDFFDSVLNHPESPGDEAIHDDLLIDRWVNEQVMKAKKAKAQQAKGSPVTYIDAAGRRRTMNQTSTTKLNVNQGYRVRTKEQG